MSYLRKKIQDLSTKSIISGDTGDTGDKLGYVMEDKEDVSDNRVIVISTMPV